MWNVKSSDSSESSNSSFKTRFVQYWTDDSSSEEGSHSGPDPNEASRRQARWALMAMSFFMGDVQQGLGPFLGVFLQQRGWSPGLRGSVTTAGGMTALAFHAPLGALIDRTSYKRTIALISLVVISVATLIILLKPAVWVVFICQILTAIAGIVPVPAMTAMTLGVTRQGHFQKFNGINQAFNHAGMMAGAGVSALIGSRFGLPAVFYWTIALGGAAVLSVLLIPAAAIDHNAARGMEMRSEVAEGMASGDVGHDHELLARQSNQPQEKTTVRQDELCTCSAILDGQVSSPPPSTPPAPAPVEEKGPVEGEGSHAQQFKILFRCKPLLLLAAMLLAFHFGNAAVLPFYGQAVVAAGKGDPAAITGLTVVVAQGVMIPMSFLAAHGANVPGWRGYWLVMLVSFSSLPLRCALAGSVIEAWGVWPVQILDGVGAGLQSVSTPGVVARVLDGTGRVNVGLGAVMMCQNVGAALSNLFCGWLVELRGYKFALYLLGIFPLISVALLIVFFRTLSSSRVFLK